MRGRMTSGREALRDQAVALAASPRVQEQRQSPGLPHPVWGHRPRPPARWGDSAAGIALLGSRAATRTGLAVICLHRMRDTDGFRHRSERVKGKVELVPWDFLRAVGDSASSASDSPASPWPLNTNSRIVARRRGRSHCGRNSRVSSRSSGAGECVSSQGMSIASCAAGLKASPINCDQQ